MLNVSDKYMNYDVRRRKPIVKNKKRNYTLPLVALSATVGAAIGISKENKKYVKNTPKVLSFKQFCDSNSLLATYSKTIASNGLEKGYEEYKSAANALLNNFKKNSAPDIKMSALKHGSTAAAIAIFILSSAKLLSLLLPKYKNDCKNKDNINNN